MDDTRIEEFFLSLSLILNSVPTYKCIEIVTKVIPQKSSDHWLQLFCHHVYCVKHGVSNGLHGASQIILTVVETGPTPERD